LTLTKSGFLEYRRCPKSFWLKTNRNDEVDWPAPSAFARMLMRQGYAVEDEAKRLVAGWPDASGCEFQVSYSAEGLEARADLIRFLPDGDIDLFEIKSSTSIEDGDYLDDATFQTIVVERSGARVRGIHIIHVNKDYVRQGPVSPEALLVITDVTAQARSRQAELERQIAEALSFLGEATLDEAGCSCLFLGNPENHCVTFERFNPGIAQPSLYILPRIARSRLEKFHAEDRFTLAGVAPEELTPRQALVRNAAVGGVPIINAEGIAAFIQRLEWPLHFYDYETFGSAVPIADGHRPHAQMPVQFSLHRLEQSGELSHFEYLADGPGQQRDLVEALEASVGPVGDAISWNKGFEAACNRRMADLLPDKVEFLHRLNGRTHDLMDPFASDYVDARFAGSTSIKKVLPVLVPGLAYSATDVHDGTGAMEAWLRLISSEDDVERAELRRQLLGYCALDSLAMVEIFRVLAGIT
jgi:hypothetical protein